MLDVSDSIVCVLDPFFKTRRREADCVSVKFRIILPDHMEVDPHASDWLTQQLTCKPGVPHHLLRQLILLSPVLLQTGSCLMILNVDESVLAEDTIYLSCVGVE